MPVLEAMCRTHPALLCLFAFVNAENAADWIRVNERIITVVTFDRAGHAINE